MPALPTDGPACSSLLPTPRATGGGSATETVQLLPTPTTQDAANTAGPSQLDRKSLPLNAVVTLLPTPLCSDGGGLRGSSAGWGLRDESRRITQRSESLLPTPRAQNGEERNQLCWLRPPDQPQNLENALARLPGVSTLPLSPAGSPSSGDPLHGQLGLDDEANG